MTTAIEFSVLPALGRLYVRAAIQRRSAPMPETTLPDLRARARVVTTDPAKLASYRRVAAIAPDGRLPLPYPQVLATPLHAALVAHPEFPLPALGMVHLENRITQHRAILEEETLDICCYVSGQKWDPRLGLRFAIATEVSVDGELVWESELWALSRGEKSNLEKRERKPRAEPTPGEPANRLVSTVVDLPADLGRRYAAVCGDYNPIHLTPVTAKAFGFKQPIIHGMWTLARCWAEVASLVEHDGLRMTVGFKKPVFLPSKILIAVEAAKEGLRYSAEDVRGQRTFVTGEVVRESL